MSASVLTLRKIFLDPTISIRRRIEAAEAVLTFESPPDVADDARAFLAEIFENLDHDIDLRLDALKVMRKAEARRVTQPILSPGEAHRNREAWRKKAIDERRKELIEAGLWPAPDDWADDLKSPDWVPPPGNPNPPLDVENLGDRMRAARLKLKAEKSSG
jgi:hypothetical protein